VTVTINHLFAFRNKKQRNLQEKKLKPKSRKTEK